MLPMMILEARYDRQNGAVRVLNYLIASETRHITLFHQAELSLRDPDAVPAYWICPTCGATFAGEAPDSCPTCGTAGTDFELVK
jgi:rubrerythrin